MHSTTPEPHSQKQSAHLAVDVTAQVVPCWLGSWLNCNLWLVLGQWNQLGFQLIQLDITGAHCLNAPDSGVSSWVNGNSPGSASFEHWVFPAFNQPIQLNIDRKLTEMMIYSGMSYFLWECRRFPAIWLVFFQPHFQGTNYWLWCFPFPISKEAAFLVRNV